MRSNQLFIEFKTELLKIKNKKKLEETYYEKLTKCLKSGQFEAFELLFNLSINLNIFIDIKRIPNLLEIVSNLLHNCLYKISSGYQTSALGEIVNILRLCNKYNLFEEEINESEAVLLENLKKDTLFLSNLNDLFGKVSNSFILYVYKIMPNDLYNYFINNPDQFFPNTDDLMYYIKHVFFDQYTIYGLNVRFLSSIDDFIKIFEEKCLDLNIQLKNEEDNLFIPGKELFEFDVLYKNIIFNYDLEQEPGYFETKKHLISPHNILKNKQNILNQNKYNFYSLSMVLHGGLGPQGLGFTYSTPKGEVIEICSDSKQNKAIIIKFRKFLKTQFIHKLNKEMTNLHFQDKTIEKIVHYLTDALEKEEIISYFNKDSILLNIKKFLFEDNGYTYFTEEDLEKLLDKISVAIQAILRPIKMMDQYKARMNLVAKDLLKSEDIAKLTSLKGKSHYDVLSERFFFQYIVKWFYEIYKNKKLKT